MWGGKERYEDLVADNRLFFNFSRVIFAFFGLVFLVCLFVFLSINLNVYFHEAAHYHVAQSYELNPSLHIDNMIEFNDGLDVRFNMKPSAYVMFDNPKSDKINFEVTLAGPLMNIFIFLALALFYLILRFILSLYRDFHKVKRNHDKLWKVTKIIFFVDVIFISLIVPSLVSIFVNLSNLPGSDGQLLRELWIKIR